MEIKVSLTKIRGYVRIAGAIILQSHNVFAVTTVVCPIQSVFMRAGHRWRRHGSAWERRIKEAVDWMCEELGTGMVGSQEREREIS